MKKVIFICILFLFLPLILNAQDNIKKETNNYAQIINYQDKTVSTLQELNSNLVDEYGINNLKFVKFENGKYIPVRASEVKKINDITETQISDDVILIAAIVGVILVAIIVIKSL
ncbi:hypothetical protein ACFLSV_01320 [Bacteroidota bacterium]